MRVPAHFSVSASVLSCVTFVITTSQANGSNLLSAHATCLLQIETHPKRASNATSVERPNVSESSQSRSPVNVSDATNRTTRSTYVYVGYGSCLSADRAVEVPQTESDVGSSPRDNCEHTCDSDATCTGYDDRETGCVFYHGLIIAQSSGFNGTGFSCYRKAEEDVIRTLRVEIRMRADLQDIHNGQDGPVATFLETLKTEISKAANVPDSRIIMLGLRDGAVSLDKTQADAGQTAVALLLALQASLSENTGFTTADVEVLPGPYATDTTPGTVVVAWLAQLADPVSELQTGNLSNYLRNATLTVAAGPREQSTKLVHGGAPRMVADSFLVLLLSAIVTVVLSL